MFIFMNFFLYIVLFGLALLGVGALYFGIFVFLREFGASYPSIAKYLFVCIVAYFVCRIIFESIIKDHVEKCQHGIRGGKTRKQCTLCIAEEEEATLQRILQVQKEKEQNEMDVQLREKERLNKIKRRKFAEKANSWRESERLRLKKYYLHQTKQFHSLNPYEFEKLVGQVFTSLGYEVQMTPRTNDQGCDAIMHKNGKIVLVECKLYAANRSIGRPLIQKFHSAMNHFKATSGYFVTTGIFANTAIRYAEGKSIKLIGPQKLLSMMGESSQVEPPVSVSEICRNCGEFVIFSLSPIENEKNCTCGAKVTNAVFNSSTEISAIIGQPAPCCPLCEKNTRMVVIDKNGDSFWQCGIHAGIFYTVNEDGIPLLAERVD